mgnify:CR=1 FL=1
MNLFPEEQHNSSHKEERNKPSGLELGYEEIFAAVLFHTFILHSYFLVVDDLTAVDFELKWWTPSVDVAIPWEWAWATFLFLRLVVVVSVPFLLKWRVFFLLIARGLNLGRLSARF